MPSIPLFLTNWQLRVLFASSLLSAVVATSESQAGCGDYVVIGAEAEQGFLALHRASTDQPSSKPSSGPQSERGNKLPQSPAQPRSNTRLTEQASILVTVMVSANNPCISVWQSLPFSLSDGFPLGVDRPPQY